MEYSVPITGSVLLTYAEGGGQRSSERVPMRDILDIAIEVKGSGCEIAILFVSVLSDAQMCIQGNW